MTETVELQASVGEVEWRCRGDEHDYQQFGRALVKVTITESPHVTTNEYDQPRLYCRKCGWVRDVPSRF